MPKHYYSMTQPEQGGPVELYIYGDILCEDEPTPSGSVSSHRLAVALEGLNASAVTVYINSYGGHTSEGLAIYHALRRLECPITTVCDGFACSAASLVFMAGDRRVMQQASLLMIHNAWLPACGNAAQLRKVAEDLDKMEQLGMYEVVPEDMALCEFVCTSKTPVQEILEKGIELMIKELS